MKKLFILGTFLFISSIPMVSCTDDDDKDPNFMPPDIVMGGGDVESEYPEDLPAPGASVMYTPSLNANMYRPISVKYSSAYPPISSWKTENTRIIAYMDGYKPAIKTLKAYQESVNKYGSSTTLPKQAATGRFYTKKIDGRWWLVDPEGCLHLERSATSLRKGTSSRNKTAWNSKFGTDEKWLSTTQRELSEIGFHGTGAFCTGTYSLIQTHNASNPSSPLTLAPSFAFLSQFKSAKSYNYPGGSDDNAAGLVFYNGWTEWCELYLAGSAFADYLRDPNVLGFFSDNEINFSSNSSRILDRFLAISNSSDPAYVAAKAFMDSKGTQNVTDDLNNEFAGIVAEKYYKAVKEAVKKVDDKLLYLGTRLHGTPKYMEGVVRAAGKYCDVISINYYSRWSPELTTAIADWANWADKPFLVSEFYTKGVEDSDLNNQSGAGYSVPTQNERAYAYQHFTLGLLEAKNCIGWHWFKYQDDDGTDNSSKPANKGLYDNSYQLFPYLSFFARELNFNAYDLIQYFDK
ncbi:hypothetical protein PL482_02940 [Bacteroides xylanisolvens]|uniref:hypothetical protein n=1 Tax=Bacteroides xylanisolvens TaxID=371601 RepID=UPI00189CB2C1|nr:hypothetical protein [Bacteroides xylanisolvens]MDB0710013.1 hypothetical protein [Bacteroides xylanisolvens]